MYSLSKNNKTGGNLPMTYKSDDKYLYDLNVRVKRTSEPGQYEYVVKMDIFFEIERVLTRCYYRYDTVKVSEDETKITTNCEPNAFKMVYERALMDKHESETGEFALTANEQEDHILSSAILEASHKNCYTSYNSFD